MATSVRATAYYTRNLGNFENAKIGYEIETDEFRDGEKIDDVKDRLKAKINAWVQTDIREIDADAGN